MTDEPPNVEDTTEEDTTEEVTVPWAPRCAVCRGLVSVGDRWVVRPHFATVNDVRPCPGTGTTAYRGL